MELKVWFSRVIYHTSKHFCACVGTCKFDFMPLSKGPGLATSLKPGLFFKKILFPDLNRQN